MRFFSEKEKLIIKQLVIEASNTWMYLPVNLFNDIFSGKNVGFDGNNMELVFPYDGNSTPPEKEIFPIYNEILERSLLIDYLEKQGLIFFVPPSSTTNDLKTIGNVSRLGRISMEIDKTIGIILLRTLTHTVHVSETLKDYVHCDFRSLEEQALGEAKTQTKLSQKQTCYSLITVLLALIAIILSIFQSCKNNCIMSSKGNDSTSISLPTNAMLNNGQNELDSSVNTTKNTYDIKAKVYDSTVNNNQ